MSVPVTRAASRVSRHAPRAVLLAAALLAPAAPHAQTALHERDPYIEHLPPPPAAPHVWQRLELGPAGRRYPFAVYASRRLDTPQDLDGIRRVVVVVHDERRDADAAYRAITQLFGANRARAQDTLVVAPKFPGPVDAGLGAMPAWRRTDWMDGLPSMAAAGRPASVGAYQVLDDLLRALAAPGRLPALRTIVLAGHGGGAQMAQRYAALNNVDEGLRAAGIGLSYVLANADSYLYFSPERPRAGGGGFERYERGICPTYDQFRYGMDNLPAALKSYVGKLDRTRLAARYGARRVVYLLGDSDNNPEHGGLDKGCGAEAQGATRLARGTDYWRYETRLAARLPASIAAHQAFLATGVGHAEDAMYGSVCGTQALLGPQAQADIAAARCRQLARAEDGGAATRGAAPRSR